MIGSLDDAFKWRAHDYNNLVSHNHDKVNNEEHNVTPSLQNFQLN